MKQMIESAFSFEMSKQQDDFSELFFTMYQVKIT